MKFYTFRQNNSGGSFVFDPKRGISCYVIVEAKNAPLANNAAEEIGLYWDGVSAGKDCGCCGDRWYETYEAAGKDKPTANYSIVVGPRSKEYPSTGEFDWKWMADGEPEGYIHYASGKVVGFWSKGKSRLIRRAA